MGAPPARGRAGAEEHWFSGFICSERRVVPFNKCLFFTVFFCAGKQFLFFVCFFFHAMSMNASECIVLTCSLSWPRREARNGQRLHISCESWKKIKKNENKLSKKTFEWIATRQSFYCAGDSYICICSRHILYWTSSSGWNISLFPSKFCVLENTKR